MQKRLIVIGGGAAGFFGAIRAAELMPEMEVCILEKSAHTLSKVKISGGGRCNVTHACFDPAELITYYPRGNKEMRGPFSRFQPGDTFGWFEERGVLLKTEDDGRVFPVTDKSQTIIDCFEQAAQAAGVRVVLRSGVTEIQKDEATGEWIMDVSEGNTLRADALLITAGSSPQMWEMIAGLGHTIVPPVPSLFTFNCTDPRIDGLAGLVAPHGEVRIAGTRFEESGPVLITHWGLSGPGILKLSARASRELAESGYNFEIDLNWDSSQPAEELLEQLKDIRTDHPRRQVNAFSPTRLPQRLWEALITTAVNPEARWADISNATMQMMCKAVYECRLSVRGKSTFKEEFVTAGGVELREIDFTTMESRLHKNLFFAGEVLNIDAVTGGFNFQAAWTTGWIAGTAIASRH